MPCLWQLTIFSFYLAVAIAVTCVAKTGIVKDQDGNYGSQVPDERQNVDYEPAFYQRVDQFLVEVKHQTNLVKRA